MDPIRPYFSNDIAPTQYQLVNAQVDPRRLVCLDPSPYYFPISHWEAVSDEDFLTQFVCRGLPKNS